MHKATIKNQSAVMNKGSTVVIRPARNVSGSVRLPGDKSISHRYAMLAGIAEGKTHLENFFPAPYGSNHRPAGTDGRKNNFC